MKQDCEKWADLLGVPAIEQAFAEIFPVLEAAILSIPPTAGPKSDASMKRSNTGLAHTTLEASEKS